MKLEEVVSNRALEERRGDGPTCPDCGKKDGLKETSHTCTLVGSMIRGHDPNHHWVGYTCSCGSRFIREYKEENVWYTRDTYVLKGKPSCFETYIYSCIRCSRPVFRTHLKLDGSPTDGFLRTSNVDGRWVKQYTTHYTCSDCGHGGLVEDEP